MSGITRVPSPISSEDDDKKDGLIEDDAVSVVASEAPNALFIKDLRFWMVFFSICLACFICALDLTSIAIVLPTIAFDLEEDAGWFAFSFALAGVVFIPLFGNLAEIFGRRRIMLLSLLLFFVGSLVIATTLKMSIAITGRCIEGIGAGGILTITDIIIVDTIPLAERGLFFGILGAIWAFSCAVGPWISGSLVDNFDSLSNWRYIFWINLPIAGFAFGMVFFFLNYVDAPQNSWKEKIHQLDYVNIVFFMAATSFTLGIAFVGEYSWVSTKVLVPLLLGFLGLLLYVFIEFKYVKYPTVPFAIINHKTSILGYCCNVIHGGVFTLSGVYFLPFFFQGVIGLSPYQIGLNLFAIGITVTPFSILAGILINKLGRYKWVTCTGWALSVLGLGLSTTLTSESSQATYLGYFIVVGFGVSINLSAATFAVLAPLLQHEQPLAVAFLAFSRAFGALIAISLGATLLATRLLQQLPDEFKSGFSVDYESVLSILVIVVDLEEPLKSEVQVAVTSAVRELWYICLGLSGIGFIMSLFMREFKLSNDVPFEWVLKRQVKTEEKTEEVVVV